MRLLRRQAVLRAEAILVVHLLRRHEAIVLKRPRLRRPPARRAAGSDCAARPALPHKVPVQAGR